MRMVSQPSSHKGGPKRTGSAFSLGLRGQGLWTRESRGPSRGPRDDNLGQGSGTVGDGPGKGIGGTFSKRSKGKSFLLDRKKRGDISIKEKFYKSWETRLGSPSGKT